MTEPASPAPAADPPPAAVAAPAGPAPGTGDGDAGQPAVWRRPFLAGDGARGVGALMVFLAHVATAESSYADLQWTGLPGRDVAGIFGGETALHAAFAPARLVNLFFAFSAYLLGRPFIAWALGRTRRPNAKRFYIRRILRIMPAYWAVCALLLLWLVVLKGGGLHGFKTLGTLTLTTGGLLHAGYEYGWAAPLEPAWTVRVEALGYLVLPAVAYVWFWAGRRFGMRGVASALVVTTAVTVAIRLEGSQLYDGPGLLLWIFMPGLAVAAVEAHEPLQQWLARRGQRPTLWFIAAGVLVLLASEPVSTHIASSALEGLDTSAVPRAEALDRVDAAVRSGALAGVPMQLVGSGVIVLGLIAYEWQNGSRRAAFGLDGRVVRWFGERSYSFYLVHFAVLGALLPRVATGEKGALGLVALALATFVVSMALTVVLFRFVELPGMFLAARLTGKRPPGPLAVAELEDPAGRGRGWRRRAARALGRTTPGPRGVGGPDAADGRADAPGP
jgi:peptidoglycan/LPS O-acetylase OafA/YrhL